MAADDKVFNSMTEDFIKYFGDCDPFLIDDHAQFKKYVGALKLPGKSGHPTDVHIIGGGSGYSSCAIAAKTCGKVIVHEIDREAYGEMNEKIAKMEKCYDISNIKTLKGDGFKDKRVFDALAVFAAAKLPDIVNRDKGYSYYQSTGEGNVISEFCKMTNMNGRGVIPMGDTVDKMWSVGVCADAYAVNKTVDGVYWNKMKDSASRWYPLVGKVGFSKKEIDAARKESSISDDNF